MATKWTEKSPAAVAVLVVERDKEILTTLGDLLEDQGYAVFEADNQHEALALIETAPEPMVVVVGNAEVPDQNGLEFFTSVAANSVAGRAYIYLTTVPERRRLPELVDVLSKLQTPVVNKPFELVALLAAVAAAAARLRS